MKNSNGEKAALDYLERDSVLNADMINTLRSNTEKCFTATAAFSYITFRARFSL